MGRFHTGVTDIKLGLILVVGHRYTQVTPFRDHLCRRSSSVSLCFSWFNEFSCETFLPCLGLVLRILKRIFHDQGRVK